MKTMKPLKNRNVIAIMTIISLAFSQAIPAGIAADEPGNPVNSGSVSNPGKPATDIPPQEVQALPPSGAAIQSTHPLSATVPPATPQGPVGVGVIVHTDPAGVVTSIQVGQHGSFLSRSTLNKLFDANKDGVVTQQEFDSKKQTVNWDKYYVAPVRIVLSNGATAADADDLQQYMDEAKRYMAELDFTFRPPKVIYLGDGASGNYSDGTTWHLALNRAVMREVAVSKVVQSCVMKTFPRVQYTAMEAFSRYFLYAIMGFSTSQLGSAYSYNTSFERLTGQNIYNAYQRFNAGRMTRTQLDAIIRDTANNNLALSQMMLELKDSIGISACNTLVLQALRSLGANQRRNDFYNAFMSASMGTSYFRLVSTTLIQHRI